MTLKNLYSQPAAPNAQATNAVNEAGGRAYENSPEWQLTKLITTGMIGDTYYADAKSINDKIFDLATKVDTEFLAKAIVYARNAGYMRANPIQLLVLLSVKNPELFRKVFKHVLKNAGDALDFATVVLSQQIRKEFGSGPRKAMRDFLNWLDPYQYIKYKGSSQNPSLRDLVRVIHPKPKNEEYDQMFRWVTDKRDKAGNPTWDVAKLPEKVRAYLRFQELVGKTDAESVAERKALLATTWIPHEVATGAGKLSADEWTVLAQNMPYMATLRMLNAMAKQGVFNDENAVKAIAEKLGNEEAVVKAKQFPYRFLSAYVAAESNIPQRIKSAIGKALEVATRNVPAIDGLVVVAPDVSGSMHSSINNRSSVRHIDVAALVSAAIVRKNPDAKVVPFDLQNHAFSMNADDTVLTNSDKLRKFGGGGTDVGLPFEYILEQGLAPKLKLLVAVTDSESWASRRSGGWSWGKVPKSASATDSQTLWRKIRAQNPDAQAILINVAPYTTDQFKEHVPGLTMVSGFSDEVFRLMQAVTSGDVEGQVAAIRAISLD